MRISSPLSRDDILFHAVITFLIINFFQGIPTGHYRLGQAGVKVNQLEFIADLSGDLTVTVVTDETFCEIVPGKYYPFPL